jgi:hypothetical protein
MLNRISSLVGPLSTHPKARVAYRYYRFNTTKIRDKTADIVYPEGIVQVSQFELMYAGGFLSYTGATASNPSGDNPPSEEPDKAIDGTVETKWVDRSSRSTRPLIIDFGTRKVADSFRFATANDVDGRDPVRWTIDGSNDNVNWTTLHTQSTDASITTSRKTYTQVFKFTT